MVVVNYLIRFKYVHQYLSGLPRLNYTFGHKSDNWKLYLFAVPFYGLALYTYYHGIVQHSGITFKSRWWQPWQPDCMFHDNHHQYCHVNYGFNCSLWDKVSGTFEKIKREREIERDLMSSKFFVSDTRIHEKNRSLLQRAHRLLGCWSFIDRLVERRTWTGEPGKDCRESISLP